MLAGCGFQRAAEADGCAISFVDIWSLTEVMNQIKAWPTGAVHSEGDVNACIRFHGSASDGWWEIALKPQMSS